MNFKYYSIRCKHPYI